MWRKAAQMCSCQTSAEHFQQCAEFVPLRNRGLGPLAVTILPIPFARRAAATACTAVQPTAPLFVAGDRQRYPLFVRAPHCRAVWNCTGCWAATTSDQGRAHHPAFANCLFHSSALIG